MFVVGPTQSPTPADQLPAPGAGGSGKLMIVGCSVVAIIAIVAVVVSLASS